MGRKERTALVNIGIIAVDEDLGAVVIRSAKTVVDINHSLGTSIAIRFPASRSREKHYEI